MNRYITPSTSSELIYRHVILVSAADVAQYSFIVQPSLSYLNLELTRSYPTRNLSEFGDYAPVFPNPKGDVNFSFSSDMIFTEEKCRKILGKNRDLLYNLHLDLPKSKEWSLKLHSRKLNSRFEITTDGSALHISKITVTHLLCFHIVSRLVEYACNHTDHSYAALHWFIKICTSASNGIPFYSDNPCFVTLFANLIANSEIVDPKFLLGCFNLLEFDHWLEMKPEPIKVENLLFKARQVEKTYDRNYGIQKFKYHCFLTYEYMGCVIKIQNAPKFENLFTFNTNAMVLMTHCSSDRGMVKDFFRDHPEPRRRVNLIQHLLSVWMDRRLDCAVTSEALRLVWDSIPDVFLTRDDIVASFPDTDSFKAADVYKFYAESIGETDSRPRPRSLKHLARISIRRRLVEGKHWLPSAISEIGLPSGLQSYLNLEKTAAQMPCIVKTSVKRSESHVKIYS